MSIKFIASTVLTAKDMTKGVFADMAKNAKHAEQSVRALRKTGESLSGMGRGLATTVSAPIIGLGANALMMATDFESAMNNVQAKLLISGKEMEGLRSKADELGISTAFSGKQAADAMGFLAQAGFNANKILSSTPIVLNLASAAQMDLARAADIASDVMGQFGFEADKQGKNITRVADVLANASAKSNTSVGQMFEALKQGGPFAKQYGIQIEEAAAALGKMADSGIKGSQAGMVLKTLFTNLGKPVGDGSKALKKLGLTMSSFFKKNEKGKEELIGISHALEQLQKAGANNADITSIFGKEAAAGIFILRDAGKEIDILAEKLEESGIASKMAKIQMQGLPRVMKEMKSAWEGANKALVMSGAFDPLIEGFKSLTKGMQNLAESDPKKLQTIVKVLAGAALAAPALMILGGTLAGIASTVKVVAGGFALLNAPVIAVAALFAGAAYVIYKNWNKLKVFFDGLSKGLAPSFKAIGSALSPIVDIFDWAYKAISNFFTPLETYNYQSTVQEFNNISSAGEALGKAIGLMIDMSPLGLIKNWEGISATFGGFLQSTKDGFNSFVDDVILKLLKFSPKELIFDKWDSVKGYFSGMLTGLEAIFTNGLAKIVGLWESWNPVKGLTDKIPDSFKSFLGINDEVTIKPKADFSGTLASLDALQAKLNAGSTLGDIPSGETLVESKLAGSVKAEIEVKLDLSDNLKVKNTGIQTKETGSLMKNLGVSMMVAE